MLNFFINNLSTIFVGAIVATVVIFIAIKMYNDKKNGKSNCGCNCANCPSKGICHTK